MQEYFIYDGVEETDYPLVDRGILQSAADDIETGKMICMSTS